MMIHKTAIIEDGAVVPKTCSVGAYSIIGPDVVLGENVYVHSHVVISGRTQVGDNCQIFPFASIGSVPQDLKFHGEKSTLVIGDNCTIREHVTMNPGTESGAMETRVGSNCLFMMGSHVAHDCVVGDRVILANNATLAGHVQVGNHVILGGLAAVRQFVRIGDYAMIGGLTGVENDVLPYALAMGERGYLAGLNLVGLERNGFDKKEIVALNKLIRTLFDDDSEGNFAERVEDMRAKVNDNTMLADVLKFIDGKDFLPLCRPKS